jgi:hypothetical protein
VIGASLSPCRDKGRWPYPDPAPLAMVPLRGFGGDGAGAVATEKDPQMSHSKTPSKTKLARAKTRAKRPTKPGNIPSGSNPQPGPSRRPSSPCLDSPRGQRSPL